MVLKTLWDTTLQAALIHVGNSIDVEMYKGANHYYKASHTLCLPAFNSLVNSLINEQILLFYFSLVVVVFSDAIDRLLTGLHYLCHCILSGSNLPCQPVSSLCPIRSTLKPPDLACSARRMRGRLTGQSNQGVYCWSYVEFQKLFTNSSLPRNDLDT